jgi:hypothetical protein
VKFILDEIKNNKTITMQDLLEKLKEKYPTLTLSRFHLNQIVNDNNITLKITRIRQEPNKRFMCKLLNKTSFWICNFENGKWTFINVQNEFYK